MKIINQNIFKLKRGTHKHLERILFLFVILGMLGFSSTLLKELQTGRDGKIINGIQSMPPLLSSSPDIEWQIPCDYDVISPILGDLHEDPGLEIVTVNSTGHYMCVNGSGDILWTYAGKTGIQMLINDVECDGNKEIIIYTGDGEVLILNGEDGTLQSSFNFEK